MKLSNDQIEALVEATRLLDDNKYALLAEEVFFQHPFNEDCGLWNCLEIDGQVLAIDGTFNHQLWFAACASLIECGRKSEIMVKVKRFMDCLPQNITIFDNGLIYHPIEWMIDEQVQSNFISITKIRGWIGSLLKSLRNRQWPERKPNKEQIKEDIYKREIYRSVGYHSFNMYAFRSHYGPGNPDTF